MVLAKVSSRRADQQSSFGCLIQYVARTQSDRVMSDTVSDDLLCAEGDRLVSRGGVSCYTIRLASN